MLLSCFRSCGGGLLVLLPAMLASQWVMADEKRYDTRYPEDPFRYQYEPLSTREVGTAPGQLHLMALAALVSGDNSEDTYLGGKLGAEYIVHEYVGLRLSGFQDLIETNDEPLTHTFSSVRAGTVIHLNPYSRFDLGAYGDVGLLVVDAVDGKTSDKAVEGVLGGFMTFYTGQQTFVRLELERAWCNVEIDNVPGSQHRTAAMMGLGILF